MGFCESWILTKLVKISCTDSLILSSLTQSLKPSDGILTPVDHQTGQQTQEDMRADVCRLQETWLWKEPHYCGSHLQLREGTILSSSIIPHKSNVYKMLTQKNSLGKLKKKKRHYSFSPLFPDPHLSLWGKPAVRHSQPCGEAYRGRNWGLQPTAKKGAEAFWQQSCWQWVL